ATPDSDHAIAGTSTKPEPSLHTGQFASVSAWASWLNGNQNLSFMLSALIVLVGLIGFASTHKKLLLLKWEQGKRFAAVHPMLDLAILVGIGIIIGSLSRGFIA